MKESTLSKITAAGAIRKRDGTKGACSKSKPAVD
jgi:hypothetical protein